LEQFSNSSSSTEVRVGPLLSKTLSIVFGTPHIFLGIPLLALIPGVALAFLGAALTMATGVFGTIVIFLALLLCILMMFAAQGATTYAVYRILLGDRPTIRESFSKGMSHIGTLFFASILLSLGIGLGFVLLIIPGVILACMWAVTVPACVVEGRGAIDGIQRSAELTKGYRWSILGIQVLLYLLVIVLNMISQVLAFIPFLGAILAFLLALIPSGLFSAACALLYYNLLAAKEGITVESLANVFD
jgi:Cation/multidrug efflux pump